MKPLLCEPCLFGLHRSPGIRHTRAVEGEPDPEIKLPCECPRCGTPQA